MRICDALLVWPNSVREQPYSVNCAANIHRLTLDRVDSNLPLWTPDLTSVLWMRGLVESIRLTLSDLFQCERSVIEKSPIFFKQKALIRSFTAYQIYLKQCDKNAHHCMACWYVSILIFACYPVRCRYYPEIAHICVTALMLGYINIVFWSVYVGIRLSVSLRLLNAGYCVRCPAMDVPTINSSEVIILCQRIIYIGTFCILAMLSALLK